MLAGSTHSIATHEDLPDEIWLLCCLKLSIQELYAFSLVSHRMHQIAQDNLYWKAEVRRFPSNFDRAEYSYKTIYEILKRIETLPACDLLLICSGDELLNMILLQTPKFLNSLIADAGEERMFRLVQLAYAGPRCAKLFFEHPTLFKTVAMSSTQALERIASALKDYPQAYEKILSDSDIVNRYQNTKILKHIETKAEELKSQEAAPITCLWQAMQRLRLSEEIPPGVNQTLHKYGIKKT